MHKQTEDEDAIYILQGYDDLDEKNDNGKRPLTYIA